MELPTNAPAQVAFAVPKRYIRLAVDRNRMKR
jgi:RNase P protein component